MDNKLHTRKYLPHAVPDWVPTDSVYFITVCTNPKGINQLCIDDVYLKIKESTFYYQHTHKWWIHFFLLMPDHVHGLVSFTYSPDLHHTVSGWKRYIAKECRVKWQRDFFDHRLRKSDSYINKENYIYMNPVRAGYVLKPEMWKYSWHN